MQKLSIFVLVALGVSAFAREQAVGARGQLMCGNQPLAGAEIKLWELDTFPDPDDLLATVTTDRDGRFQIQGHESEMGQIKPVLKVYHRCNNKGLFNLPKLCKRKTVYEIPANYITANSKVPKNLYDLGTLNMEAKQRGEATECI